MGRVDNDDHRQYHKPEQRSVSMGGVCFRRCFVVDTDRPGEDDKGFGENVR